ncbi:MAG: response regulator transcription factor [Thermoleophilia bacterium]
MRLVLADDAVLIREGLARLLAEAGFHVVGQAGDAHELLRLVDDVRPDVAVVDIRMPPTHTDEGLRAAIEIRTRQPGVGVLVLSQHVEPSYALELLQHGAEGVGYLLKERVAHLAELTDAIGRVAAGGSALDPTLIAQLVARPAGAGDPLEELSDREREVLSLMAEGRTNRAIGERLWITEHTVEKHVRSLMGKLAIPAGADDHRRVLAVLRYLDAR